MPNLGPTELLIIAAVVLVLFGSKKLPDAARSMGRSMRILKSETKGLHDDEDRPATNDGAPANHQHTASGQTQLLSRTHEEATGTSTTQRSA